MDLDSDLKAVDLDLDSDLKGMDLDLDFLISAGLGLGLGLEGNGLGLGCWWTCYKPAHCSVYDVSMPLFHLVWLQRAQLTQ